MQLSTVHWNIARLLQLGVDEEFVKSLSDREVMELLKGVTYLMEKNKRAD